jgi:hypothetical protein
VDVVQCSAKYRERIMKNPQVAHPTRLLGETLKVGEIGEELT